jgi:hypothetical protein
MFSVVIFAVVRGMGVPAIARGAGVGEGVGGTRVGAGANVGAAVGAGPQDANTNRKDRMKHTRLFIFDTFPLLDALDELSCDACFIILPLSESIPSLSAGLNARTKRCFQCDRFVGTDRKV